MSLGSGTGSTPASVDFQSKLARLGWPVPGKLGTWMIEDEEIGPNTVFGSGADPTERQDRLMKKYVLLKAGDFRCKIPGYDHQLWTDEDIDSYLKVIPWMGESSAGWFPMDIDRIDGKHRHREGYNLRESCHVHNSIYGNTAQRLGAGAVAHQGEKEKENVSTSILSPIEKRILDLSRGYDDIGRTFIFELVRKAAGTDLDPDIARVKLRNETGCSRAKSYDIMERLTIGDDSPLDGGRIDGKPVLRFRHGHDLLLSIGQLKTKYPARGYASQKGVTLD